MRTIFVSGASDDLVEVDGDVYLEGYAKSDGQAVVAINDVEALKVTYGEDGLWHVEVLAAPDGIDITVVPSLGEDVERDPQPPADIVSYSDYAIVTGDIVHVAAMDDEWRENQS